MIFFLFRLVLTLIIIFTHAAKPTYYDASNFPAFCMIIWVDTASEYELTSWHFMIVPLNRLQFYAHLPFFPMWKNHTHTHLLWNRLKNPDSGHITHYCYTFDMILLGIAPKNYKEATVSPKEKDTQTHIQTRTHFHLNFRLYLFASAYIKKVPLYLTLVHSIKSFTLN